MTKSNIDKNARILIAIIIIIIIVIGLFRFTSLGDPIKDYFADTVEGTETVWINTTEYIPIWFNFTEWLNSTEWINNTEYIPIWYNETIWINDTIWINNTEYVFVPVWYNQTIWINSTTFINYPFVEGWNISGSMKYVKLFKSGSGSGAQYKIEHFNQLTGVITSSTYVNYAEIQNMIYYKYSSGAISLQQYDCSWIQLFILYNC